MYCRENWHRVDQCWWDRTAFANWRELTPIRASVNRCGVRPEHYAVRCYPGLKRPQARCAPDAPVAGSP